MSILSFLFLEKIGTYYEYYIIVNVEYVIDDELDYKIYEKEKLEKELKIYIQIINLFSVFFDFRFDR